MAAKDLWSIVSSVRTDIDANNTKHDAKLFKFAIDAFTELNNYGLILPSGRTSKLTLDSDNSAFLPDDFIDYYKIGVCVNGYWVNFDVNENICLDRNSPCSCEEIEESLTTNSCCSSNIGACYLGGFENGQYVAGIYGMGAGFYRGGYKIDYESKKIKFDSYVNASQVFVEYRSDGGIGTTGNAFVPEILIRPMTNFVHRERCTFESENTSDRFRANFLAQQAVKFGRRYVNGVKAAVYNLKFMTADQLLATWRNSIFQTPKR